MVLADHRAVRVYRPDEIEGFRVELRLPNREVPSPRRRLLPQLELLGYRLVAINVNVMEIIQQTPALANHHQQPTA